jgi:hypothetical protein
MVTILREASAIRLADSVYNVSTSRSGIFRLNTYKSLRLMTVDGTACRRTSSAR